MPTIWLVDTGLRIDHNSHFIELAISSRACVDWPVTLPAPPLICDACVLLWAR